MLEEQLVSGTFDVFHFAGTGEVLQNVSKRGGLRQALRLMGGPSTRGAPARSVPGQLEHADDASGLMDRQDLGATLMKAGVRLAVLNACHTDWVARSLAKYIPSAIGFRDNVRVESCLTLADSLYRSLLAGSALDLSVTAARQALDRAYPGTGDWCKIIFYLQQPNGSFLLSPPSTATGGMSSAAPEDNKEVVMLSRLLDVYERNLATLQRETGSGPTVDAFREQWENLQQKRDLVKRQLDEARTPARAD